MSEANRDPWVDVRTFHGFPADQVISAIQKEIRRSQTENAILLAYEMAITSPALEDYLWQRLMVISVEDIGFGEPNAPIMLNTLYQMVNSFDRSLGERQLFAIHAVRYLCQCPKDRTSDEMIVWAKLASQYQGVLPDIPDYALDMHTAEGQKMGRDLHHFLEEGARLDPELPGRDLSYRQRILGILADIEQ